VTAPTVASRDEWLAARRTLLEWPMAWLRRHDAYDD
jgi:predicted dithiol-disulfide oxidoreductase (DUF899 family)